MNWQPIETAPFDTPVLVWDPEDSKTSYPDVYIAFKYGTDPTWWRMNGEDGYECDPTHWLPLPEPPK